MDQQQEILEEQNQEEDEPVQREQPIDVEDIRLDIVNLSIAYEYMDTSHVNHIFCERGQNFRPQINFPIKIRPIYSFQPFHVFEIQNGNQNSENSLTAPRSGHRVVASDSKLYLLGGYDIVWNSGGRNQLYNDLWSFNCASKEWKLMLNESITPNMSTELISSGLVLHGNVLISHGGTKTPFGESFSNNCFIYTTDSVPHTMSLRVTGDCPPPMYGSNILILKKYLYAVAGRSEYHLLCDVYRLNLETKVWKHMYNAHRGLEDFKGRCRQEIICDGSFLYLLGGGCWNFIYDFKTLPRYNLKVNVWNDFETLCDTSLWQFNSLLGNENGFPMARQCFSCVQHKITNGDVVAYISGGYGSMHGGNVYLNDMWQLNLRTRQWKYMRIMSLPKPLYFHSAAQSKKGCMYICGGICEEDDKLRNYMYKVWVTIPKLSEICWEAITYYNEKLNSFNSDALRRSGIPEKFIRRLQD